MLSLEQMTITAYIDITDGDILCRACGEKAELPAKDALCDYTMQSEFEEGAWCGDCGKEIVEPYEEGCCLDVEISEGNWQTLKKLDSLHQAQTLANDLTNSGIPAMVSCACGSYAFGECELCSKALFGRKP